MNGIGVGYLRYMKFEEMQKLEGLDHKTGNFEEIADLQEIDAWKIVSMFNAEEHIFRKTLETHQWLDNIRGVMHLEFN